MRPLLQIALLLWVIGAAPPAGVSYLQAESRSADLFRNPTGTAVQSEPVYTVTRVVDGDTFWVDDGSEKGLKVRLIGVDAPETRNSGRKLKGYFGTESSEYLNSLIGGKKVRFVFDVAKYDRYGRTLAYVYLADGTFVNAELVKNGYATVMTTPPNVRHADEFVELADRARKRNRGLWRREQANR